MNLFVKGFLLLYMLAAYEATSANIQTVGIKVVNHYGSFLFLQE